MVSLDTTDREFSEVDVAELVAWFDSVISTATIPIFGVPLLSNFLICRHIVHDLTVDRDGKDTQHNEEA